VKTTASLARSDNIVLLPPKSIYRKVICVPGVFFDINPRNTRNLRHSQCLSFVRFSYGPAMDHLEKGVKNIGKMIEYWKTHQESPDMYAKSSFDD